MAVHLPGPARCGNARCHLIPPIRQHRLLGVVGYLLLAVSDHERPGVEGVQALVNVAWDDVVVLEIPFSLLLLLLLTT